MKHSLISLILIAFAMPCAAQWKDAGFRGSDAQVLAFGVHDTNFFLSSPGPGFLVFRWVIGGVDGFGWTGTDNGMDASYGVITSFASQGKYFFAGQTFSNGTNANEYSSTNDGATWNAPKIGSPVIADSSFLFGGWGDIGIAISQDSGAHWDSITNLVVSSYAVSGTILFVNAQTGVWRSSDMGSTWSKLSPPFTGRITVMGTLLFIPGNGKLAESTDNGQNWTTIPVDSSGVAVTVNCLVTDGKNLFAGTSKGVFVSTDTGRSWIVRNEGIVGWYANNSVTVTLLGLFDTLLFAEEVSTTGQGGGFGSYYILYNRPISELTSPPSAVKEVSVPVDSIQIYPNPSSGMFSVFASEPVLSVHVINVLGVDIMTVPENDRSLTLDLSNQPSGMYFLRIATPHGIVIRKITLNR